MKFEVKGLVNGKEVKGIFGSVEELGNKVGFEVVVLVEKGDEYECVEEEEMEIGKKYGWMSVDDSVYDVWEDGWDKESDYIKRVE